MKKIIASFTVIVYFAFACGVMVNYHYCMDRYTTIHLYQPASDVCAVCGMHTTKHGCCHDEVKIVKLQNDCLTSSFTFAFKNVCAATTPSEFLVAVFFNEDLKLNKTDHSPPLTALQDTYLRNCVFRI